MKSARFPLLAVAIAALGSPALAYERDEVIVRFGAAMVAPDSDSDSLLGDIAEAEDGYSLGVSATYMINSLVGIELLGALPFQHDIVGTGALQGVDIGSTEQLPPTLLLQFAPPVSAHFQPYAGVGYNYTTFFNEDTSSELDAALGAATDLSLSDSHGLALELGVDVPLGERLMLNATVWNIDIDTTARVKANGVTAVTVDVELDPWVYMVGLGMRF